MMPMLAHGAVILDDQHVRHDHELRQHQREGDVAADEVVARERVSRERAEHELAAEDQRHQHERVEEVARERRRRPGALEVVERQRREQREARGELGRMKRRPHRIGERQHPQDRQQPGGRAFQRAPDAARRIGIGARGALIGSGSAARESRIARTPRARAAPAGRWSALPRRSCPRN